MSANRFRLSGKHHFLTYPQCPISLGVAVNLIKALYKEKLEYALVCQERHKEKDKEGCCGLHLHAVVVLKNRWDIRNQNALDLTHQGITYHGNYQRVKSLYGSIKYVCGWDRDWETTA